MLFTCTFLTITHPKLARGHLLATWWWCPRRDSEWIIFTRQITFKQLMGKSVRKLTQMFKGSMPNRITPHPDQAFTSSTSNKSNWGQHQQPLLTVYFDSVIAYCQCVQPRLFRCYATKMVETTNSDSWRVHGELHLWTTRAVGVSDRETQHYVFNAGFSHHMWEITVSLCC